MQQANCVPDLAAGMKSLPSKRSLDKRSAIREFKPSGAKCR